MNELAGHFEVKLSTTVRTFLQNKVTLVYTIPRSFLPDTEQRLLFSLLHFEANDFPVLGLGVWAVTSAVMARFK